MYEIFEHTADMGLRVRADNLEALFVDAGRGLFSMMVENLDDVRPVQQVEFRIEDDDQQLDYLLFDWLNELLYRFDIDHLLLSEFHVELDSSGLRACASGETLDPDRHRLAHEVKAITYHQLRVEQMPDGWEAELIVDI